MSLTLTTALFGFISMYLSAFNSFEPLATQAAQYQREMPAAREWLHWLSQRAGLGTILTSNVLVMAPLLIALRRWRLPFGSATVGLTVSSLLMSALEEFQLAPMVAGALVGGLIVDALIQWLRPSVTNTRSMRIFAGAAPLALWTPYMLTIQLVWGLGWSLEMSSGSATQPRRLNHASSSSNPSAFSTWRRSSQPRRATSTP